MSAIERRIADFILENAHLLRDYSSQQLANALKISQSSVVKFSQKLGFKGYPDLKYSVGEAVARSNGGGQARAAAPTQEGGRAGLAESLWRSKSHAEEETRLINSPDKIESLASLIAAAGRVFCVGLGEDGISAHAFASKLALLGIPTEHQVDPLLMTASAAAAAPGDVLLVFSEHGKQTALSRIAREFRERRGKVVSITRNTPNTLRAHAHAALLISAHDERSYIEPLLYQCAQQNLLDLIFVSLCDTDRNRRTRLDANLERAQRVLDP